MTCPAARRERAGRSRPELADILREHGDRLPGLSDQQVSVVEALTRCRTEALGGHLQECDHCGYQEVFFNSCRNRHCPKCQNLEGVRWLQARQEHLLPTEYHHVVFTIPNVLHSLFEANQATAYGLLFAAVGETLREVADRPKNLGAKIGFTAVLHTWTQTLLYHPHVHCIVTGGGLSPDGDRWVSAKPGFLFAVRVLGRVFRGKLLSKLELALKAGALRGSDSDSFLPLRKAARKEWVIYSKVPFAGPEQVLRYLSRYTHRIAISNERLVCFKDGRVTFRWKDRADGNTTKLMTLSVEVFLRRFLQHVVPSGFVRIRHYGLLANSSKKELLRSCRESLGVKQHDEPQATEAGSWSETLEQLTGKDITLCPECRKGHLAPKAHLTAGRPFRSGRAAPILPGARAP